MFLVRLQLRMCFKSVIVDGIMARIGMAIRGTPRRGRPTVNPQDNKRGTSCCISKHHVLLIFLGILEKLATTMMKTLLRSISWIRSVIFRNCLTNTPCVGSVSTGQGSLQLTKNVLLLSGEYESFSKLKSHS